MAYSELEKPLYHNSRNAHFYPEENDYIPGHRGDNIAYHHPNYFKYPKNFNYLNLHEENKKTPIYVHPVKKLDNFSTRNLCYTDILKMRGVDNNPRSESKKCKKTPKNFINKLEETYWSNWKPMKEAEEVVTNMDLEKQHLPVKHFKLKKEKSFIETEESSTAFVSNIISGKSIEIQTELSSITLTKQEEEKLRAEKTDKESSDNEDRIEPVTEVPIQHTDSLIVLKMKKCEIKEKPEEPKCLRLFRKINKASIPPNRSYIRGGTYPLRQPPGISDIFTGKPLRSKKK